LPSGAGVDAIMQAYVRHLDQRLVPAPEAWLMWHEAHAIFDAPEDRR